MFPFTVSLRVLCHLKVCIHLDGAICIPWGVPSSSYQARTGDLPAREGLHLFLIIPSDFRLSGIVTESQILASGIQLMSDIIYFLIVLQPLTQITLSFTLTFTESRMNINGGIHPVPESTFGVRMNYLCCPDLLFHY